jgi:hypothetical protein
MDDLYIIAKGGLCNKLRVILSRIDGKHNLVIMWVKCGCNGEFTDCFMPLEKVKFVDNLPENASVFYEGFSADIRNDFFLNYSILKPSLEAQKKLDRFDSNYIAIHVRRTDLNGFLFRKSLRSTTDENFFDWIARYPNEKIYLATDNLHTQQIFRDKYKDRVFWNIDIIVNVGEKTLRSTSLVDAAVDLFACSKAKFFMGTEYSSFSDTIKLMRQNYLERIPSLVTAENTNVNFLV